MGGYAMGTVSLGAPSMNTDRATGGEPPEYALGYSTTEFKRLELQGRFFGDLTEDVLRRAGLGPAMRVLDIEAVNTAHRPRFTTFLIEAICRVWRTTLPLTRRECAVVYAARRVYRVYPTRQPTSLHRFFARKAEIHTACRRSE